ncbi:MAG: DNA polymerase III subunit alpha [Acidimicrobiia bacterium]|nr:DNA polymerase III subunit alpha [Acidimicrobiia bacterium]
MRVTSSAFLDGYYYKPRTDWELLERHHEGITATSGCLGGLVPQLILAGEEEAALQAAARFQDIFGREHFFIEVQDHGLADDAVVIRPLLDIARRIGAPLLATNDSHYTHAGDADAHDALLCVQTGALKADSNRFRFEAQDFYIKSAAEMRHLFRELPSACDNTLLVAERAEVEIELDNAVLPSFPVPDGEDEDSYLRALTMEGARTRYGLAPAQHVIERIEYELDVIKQMGFSSYFLVVWDLVRYAKSRGIRVGPGRGSAAGSAVAYCLQIVDIDPIRYDLLFERFLNPGRKQMPDIDMDFDSRYRGEVIKYAAQKYGADHVAQIVTFSTIKARAAVRDASRVLGYPYSMGDKIAKLMPPLVMGRDTPLRACLEVDPAYEDGYRAATDLRALYAADPDAQRVIDVAKGLEGLRRQDGIHAAGVVITKEPLTEYLPVQRKPEAGTPIEEAPIVTQYGMHGVEQLGLLKMDFLGLRNLDVIEIAISLVEASTGERVDIDNVSLEDPATFELLRRGDTIGVFQLEGGQVRRLIRSLAPTTFEDVAALVALYRPGPMGQNWHQEYADRKNGRKPIVYDHPSLEDVLAPTYGLMIYQEQLMRVSQRLAGYSLEDAENLRKATGKKIRALIAQERSKFVDGCLSNGHDRAFAEAYFDKIEPFADYSFNKSHSVGYGYVAYQTAFLKANYPVQYLAALLTSVKTNLDKAAVYLAECRSLDIPVLLPDVNASFSDFSVDAGDAAPGSADATDDKGASAGPRAIRFGLSAVRNVGEGVAEQIVAARCADGPFADFHEFCERVDPAALNKRTIESLVKAGAFDSMGHPRRGLLTVLDQAIDGAVKRRHERDQGTFSLFDVAVDDSGAPAFDSRIPVPEIEFDKSSRLSAEKEMLGLYVSDHPLLGAQSALRRLVDCTVADLADLDDGVTRSVAGVVTSLARKYTKRGDLMATFVLEDLTDAVEVMVFPKVMASLGHLLESDAIVTVKGRVDRRDETPKLMALDATRPELHLDAGPPVRLEVKVGTFTEERVGRLRDLLRAHPGDSAFFVHLVSSDKQTVLRLSDEFCCDGSSGLMAELRVLFGADCIVRARVAGSTVRRIVCPAAAASRSAQRRSRDRLRDTRPRKNAHRCDREVAQERPGPLVRAADRHPRSDDDEDDEDRSPGGAAQPGSASFGLGLGHEPRA